MESLSPLLDWSLWGNAGPEWATALAVALGLLLLFFVIKPIAVSRLRRLTRKTETVWDDAVVDVLGATRNVSLLIFALAIGSMTLTLPDVMRTIIVRVAVITLIIQGGLWALGLIRCWLERTTAERREKDPGSLAALNVMSWVARLVLWSVVLLLVLDNLGIDITAAIAGLGIGGVAVALALQSILGDLFASLSIVLDKPFVVGDFLAVGEFLGSVEYVGLKTTRLRSLSGEQLVMSNADLLQSRLRNYGRMNERRVVFKLGVTYQTPREQLKQIPGMIRAAVEAQENVRFDRSHFQGYGDFSLNFETVYYVLDRDYTLYMDVQQAINLAVHETFESKGIEFAYPTQTLFLQRQVGAEAS